MYRINASYVKRVHPLAAAYEAHTPNAARNLKTARKLDALPAGWHNAAALEKLFPRSILSNQMSGGGSNAYSCDLTRDTERKSASYDTS